MNDPRLLGKSLTRRAFLGLSAGSLTLAGSGGQVEAAKSAPVQQSSDIRLFLCGDVMTGRGIDQILPHPGDPRLCERYMKSALGYVELAEEAHGAIPRPADFAYVWGDALGALAGEAPDLRIVNLETAVTSRGDCAPKGINYRMNPANLGCLSAAGIDCCALANNHVLDWGLAGLEETLDTLQAAGLHTAGAGRDRAQALAPAVLPVAGRGRVLVFAFGTTSSGIPRQWAAGPETPGVALLRDLSPRTVAGIADLVAAVKRPGDLAVLSIHWGGNWGYEIPAQQRAFAHNLIDDAGVDLVHGHSSHHVKGIEVYRGKAILYGCGDFLTDYEGIEGYEGFRDDLVLAYLPRLDRESGRLVGLTMLPFRLRNFQLKRATPEETQWLAATLGREGARLGSAVELTGSGRLTLRWIG